MFGSPIPILVAALIPMAVGALWYGPLFGKKWQETLGFSDEYLRQGNMAVIYGVALLLAALLSFSIDAYIELTHGAQFMHLSDDIAGSFHTFGHGAMHGGAFAFMSILPVVIIKALFERRSGAYIFINAAYWLVVFALIGGVVDVWN